MRIVNRSFSLMALLLVMSVSAATAQPQELPLGSPLPMQDHTVSLVDGSTTTVGTLTGSAGTVFIFWSNQCPWVDKYEERVLALHTAFGGQGVNFVLVNANDPEAFPMEAASEGLAKNYPMPYVMDAGSQFAQALGAFRTPHVFAFDSTNTLVFTGAIDDSPGDAANVQNTYLRNVAQAMAQGGTLEFAPTKAFGCRIKFQML